MRELWDGSDSYFESGTMADPVHRVSQSPTRTQDLKVKVFKDMLISMDGYEPVWRWECDHRGCKVLRVDSSHAEYWENAIRGAFQHVKWHRSFNAQI
jgi:hypothetical protein